MRPKERRDNGQKDLFRAGLDQFIDMGHAHALGDGGADHLYSEPGAAIFSQTLLVISKPSIGQFSDFFTNDLAADVPPSNKSVRSYAAQCVNKHGCVRKPRRLTCISAQLIPKLRVRR
jgi:hypothetical protein